MTTGEEFVKKIRPLGAALFLLVFVLFLIMAFSSGRNPLPGYEPPQTSEYYAQDESRLLELQAELEENVFPVLGGGVEDCRVEGGKLRLTLKKESFFQLRKALLYHYESNLFEFIEAD